ncbi:MAG TPA: hypothetical protein VH372_11310, partial [Actinospica sp.]|nr:hypothetical protein [Actinospica sp.]
VAGVPDLFGKIRPILRSMVPGRPTPPEVRDLKRSARVIVTVWVLSMVPLLAGDLGYALWNLPRLLSTGARSLTETLSGTGSAFVHGQIAAGLVGVIGSLMLVLPLAGITYLLVRLVGRLVRTLRRVSEGNPLLRLGFCGAGAALVGGLCLAWVIGLTPKPLPPQPPIIPALQPGVPTVVITPSGSGGPAGASPGTGASQRAGSPAAGARATPRSSGSAGAPATSRPASAVAQAGTPATTAAGPATTANNPMTTAPASSASATPSSGGTSPTASSTATDTTTPTGGATSATPTS